MSIISNQRSVDRGEKTITHVIDIEGLVTDLGGSSYVARALRERGFEEITYKGLRKWMERESVPAKRLADLFVLGRSLGVDLNLYDYIRDTGETHNGNGLSGQ